MKINPKNTYATRDGRAVTGLRPNEDSTGFPWQGEAHYPGLSRFTCTWTDAGVFLHSGLDHPTDLVLVEEAPTFEDPTPRATLGQLSQAIYELESRTLRSESVPAWVFWEIKKLRHQLEPHVLGLPDTPIACSGQLPGLTNEELGA